MTSLQTPLAAPTPLQLLVPQMLCFAFQQKGNLSPGAKELTNETGPGVHLELSEKDEIINKLEKNLNSSRFRNRELVRRIEELETQLDSATNQAQGVQVQMLEIQDNLGKRIQKLQERRFKHHSNLSSCSIHLTEVAARLEEERNKCQPLLEAFSQENDNLTRLYNIKQTLLEASHQHIDNLTQLFDTKESQLNACEINLQQQIKFTKELADVFISDKEQVLSEVASSGNLTVVRLLVQLDTNLTVQDGYGYRPLEWASIAGHVDVAKQLAGAGANLLTLTNISDTPLHLAARKGHVELAKLLLDNGADLEATNKYNSTPLHEAAYYGNLEMCTLLINRGAQVNVQNEAKSTPLDYAAERGHLPLVQLLMQRGADLSIRNRHGRTPLEEARHKGRQDVVWWLEKQEDQG